MRLLLVFITCLGIIGSLLYFKKPFSACNHQLIIGTAAGYAPFVSVNAQGDYEGFDIDIAKALAAHLNKKLIIKDLGSMTSLFTALEQGSIDAIIWGLSINSWRLKKVAMVHYHGQKVTSYPLVFWNTLPEGLNGLEDMHNAIVCVEPGSSQESVLAYYPSAVPLMVEKIDDALLNIRYNKADAALVEPAIAKKFMAKYPAIKKIDIALKPEDYVQGIGIAIKKDNTALIESLKKGVDLITAQGIIAQASKRWNIE